MNEEELQGYCDRYERGGRKGKKFRKMRRHKTDRVRRISGHALERYGQRIGPKGDIGSDIDNARRNGKQWFELPPGPLQDWLRDRTASRGSGRLVVYYKGNVYVFGAPKRNGPRDVITVYPYEGERTEESDA